LAPRRLIWYVVIGTAVTLSIALASLLKTEGVRTGKSQRATSAYGGRRDRGGNRDRQRHLPGAQDHDPEGRERRDGVLVWIAAGILSLAGALT
jgi:hypothetical protein